MPRYRLPAMFEAVFKALNDSGVRYLVAGGVAVVLHGYVRITVDLDLVVDLAQKEAAAAVRALTDLGLTPRLPVDPALFAEPEQRTAWIRDKGMTVFTFHDPNNPLLLIDIFVDPPGNFEDLYGRAKDIALETTTVKIVSLDDLIAMKRQAGRPKDLIDVAELEQIRELHNEAQ